MAVAVDPSTDNGVIKSRTTKEGKVISYEMKVVQQPARARACGQGAKSSTDRRPVDPPPIIDLRIFEGEGENRKDVTQCYRAEFFAWASLLPAASSAQGRTSSTSTTTNTPVLCGMPVAAEAMLERPSPGIYFIFTDLSVRHEGRYRLSFTLNEVLKDPSLEDAEPLVATESPIGEYASNRCEIRSTEFTVYSAKKFPGLAESTALSRMVAEQGCRVRIRRDVRMRKREHTGPKDWDEFDDRGRDGPSRPPYTPRDERKYPISSHHSRAPSREPPLRPRSSSITSNVGAHAQQPPLQRQPISEPAPAQDFHPPTHNVQPPQSHTHYQAPQPSNEHQTLTAYNTGGASYVSQVPTLSSPHQLSSPHMGPFHSQVGPVWDHYGGVQQPPMPPPMYSQPTTHSRQASISYVTSPHDYGVSPTYPPYQQAPPAVTTYMTGSDSTPYGRPTSQVYPGASTRTQSLSSAKDSLPPIRNQDAMGGYDSHQQPQYADTQPAMAYTAQQMQDHTSPYYPQPPTVQQGQKRGFADAFDARQMHQPLRRGARPSENTLEETYSSSDEEDPQQWNMPYRRADGRILTRPWPMR